MSSTAIQLLSTDYDGTLIGFSHPAHCVEPLSDVLRAHQNAGGLWAINTGRSLEHTLGGLDVFAGPVEPDFLRTNARDVHRKSHGEWVEYGDWNHQSRLRHEELYVSAEDVFDSIHASYSRHPAVRIIHEHGRMAGLVTDSEGMMDRVVKELVRLSEPFPEFSFQRNTIYLRFCHSAYDKGSALTELCRLEGVPVESVLAVGDNHNDLSMLQSTRAGMVACPANAITPVRDAVKRAGGYISAYDYGEGVADSWHHFTDLNQ